MDEDLELIAAVRQGDLASFESLVKKYQPRIFATARRYARRESEVEDIVQEIFIKAYQKLESFEGRAPFEHWLMRLAVRTCYDFLRSHQRNRETSFTDLSDAEADWLERFNSNSDQIQDSSQGARELAEHALTAMSPAGRLVLTLLEIEDRSIKEVAELTGWSVPLVKVRAFRARREMKKWLERMAKSNKL